MSNLGVYIQVPFCQTKCTYCNFHTGVVSAGRFAPYADAVCREIANHRQLLASAGVTVAPSVESLAQSVGTVYIGGGTPSLLEPLLLTTMLQPLYANFHGGLTGVTLETDPETIGAEKAAQWAAEGFNRSRFCTQPVGT